MRKISISLEVKSLLEPYDFFENLKKELQNIAENLNQKYNINFI